VTLKPILLPLGLSGSQLHAKIGLDCWYWRPYPVRDSYGNGD